MSEPNAHSLSTIVADRLCLFLARNPDIECPFVEHTLESSSALANRQFSRLVVPAESNRAVLSLLIVIVVALILVEGEAAIIARLDYYLQIVPRTL